MEFEQSQKELKKLKDTRNVLSDHMSELNNMLAISGRERQHLLNDIDTSRSSSDKFNKVKFENQFKEKTIKKKRTKIKEERKEVEPRRKVKKQKTKDESIVKREKKK